MMTIFYPIFTGGLAACLTLTSCIKKEGSKGGKNFILKKEETFYRNFSVEPENLHPIKSSDVYSRVVQEHILESLLQRNPNTYELEPSLAERWERSPDGKTFVFYLHKGLKWSDGKPLTAKDVKFSLDAYKDPSYGGIHTVSYYENMKSAKIIDDRTIQFQIKEVYFKNFDIVSGMAILPEHIYMKKEENSPSEAEGAVNLNKTVIGSGPYKVSLYRKGKMLALSKNEHWFGKNVPANKGKWNFQNIVFRFIPAGNDAILRMQKGDLDFIGLSAEDFKKRTSAPQWSSGKLEKIKFSNKEPSGYGYVGFNFKKVIFQDQRTRKALAHLMNRELMNKKFNFNYYKLATGPWYSWSEYADPSVQPILFDPAEAAKLLKAAGWKDENPKDGILEKSFPEGKKNFEFSVVSTNSKDSEKYLTVFQEDLKKEGIRLSIKSLDWTTLLSVLDKKDFDMAMLGWGFSSPAIDPRQIWHSESAVKGGSNYISYSNPEVDHLIEKARRELNKNKRIQILRKVYRLIANDVPYIFLFNIPNRFYGVNNRINRPAPFLNYDLGVSFWSFTDAPKSN